MGVRPVCWADSPGKHATNAIHDTGHLENFGGAFVILAAQIPASSRAGRTKEELWHALCRQIGALGLPD